MYSRKRAAVASEPGNRITFRTKATTVMKYVTLGWQRATDERHCAVRVRSITWPRAPTESWYSTPREKPDSSGFCSFRRKQTDTYWEIWRRKI